MIPVRPKVAWLEQAVCRSSRVDPEIFFPTNRRHADGARAKALCGVCPVRLDCLEEAMVMSDTRGIWGGLDDDERDELRKRWRRRA